MKRSSSHGDAGEGNQLDPDMLVNSPLISWLKQELQGSWLRERHLKAYVQRYSERHLHRLQSRLEDVMRQRAQIRAEVEMWQMRNEEMEQRLLN